MIIAKRIGRILSVLTRVLMITSFMLASLHANDEIPESLSPWIPWVLKGSEQLLCPFINNSLYAWRGNHICAWPGVLELNVVDDSAIFKQSWQVLAKSFLPLPGDSKNWPLAVTVNSKSVVVIARKGRPFIELLPGEYTIKGQFRWQQRPESIDIPEQVAFVSLNINNRPITFPKVDNKALWLQQNKKQQQPENDKKDSIVLTVARRLSDGPYIKLETFINIKVSGKKREVKLGKVLPKGFELTGIKTPLSTFLDAEGILHAKLPPGSWQISVNGYASAGLLSWQRPAQMFAWPKEEIWVFKAQENLRLGKLTGAKIVDTRQGIMPDSWYHLPGYLVNTDDKLIYEVQHRGKPLHLENHLSLKRNLWLAFDNSSYTFSDTISGNMIENWRLSMKAPFQLESAEDQDGSVLITTQAPDERGIENRYPQLSVQARGVVDVSTRLSVTGWDSDFERVDLTLNLPPANKLIAVFGADEVINSWWGNWSIWASFIVLLSALMASRLINITAGFITVLLLVIIYQEAGAPVTIIINLLLAMAIKKHQPFERIKSLINGYWLISVILGLGAILYFSALQVRTVIHPQLEVRTSQQVLSSPQVKQTLKREELFSEKKVTKQQSMEMTQQMLEFQAGDETSAGGRQEGPLLRGVSSSNTDAASNRRKSSALLKQSYYSDAVMQAGSGIPDWQWNRYRLIWNSPVAINQDVDIIVLSPTSYGLIKILGVLLSLFWLYLLLKEEFVRGYGKLQPKALASALAVFILLPVCSPDAVASAQMTTFPDDILLAELKARVTEAPLCAPD